MIVIVGSFDLLVGSVVGPRVPLVFLALATLVVLAPSARTRCSSALGGLLLLEVEFDAAAFLDL